ncbi:putative phosphoesterase [Jannaschia faecimaris]|uniref:Putative phosphoesterase n=1 Tax=Jannaschia faecimaris TaxID=1244108 RepID=A0A1H3L5T1_9RHOB|nr:ligase-associated DNA damage response endonuclease PdeM [Jannaschia faecimaris]SDY59225.1 putative phosphoesterase [Jannaschia faecimaris]
MRDNHTFTFAGHTMVARASGALHWPAEGLLVVSDLHFGKSERMARNGGALLPPYEVQDTLTRLDADIEATQPHAVISLGDTFDDMMAAHHLQPAHLDWIKALTLGRDWTWVTGNHDPAPTGLGGESAATVCCADVTLRHIASGDAQFEISGHYHPKASLRMRGRAVSRRCFLRDAARMILPAYGTYTGGLQCHDPALTRLMAPDARAILAGSPMVEIPMPR